MESRSAEGIYASTADSQHHLLNTMNQDQGLTLYPASQSFPSANLLSQSFPAQVVASSNDAFGSIGTVTHQSAECSDQAGGSLARDITRFLEDDYELLGDMSGGGDGLEVLLPMADNGELTGGDGVGEEPQNNLLEVAPTVAFTKALLEVDSHGPANAQSSTGIASFPGPTLPPTTCANAQDFGRFPRFQITAAPATGVPGSQSASTASSLPGCDTQVSTLLPSPAGFHVPRPRYLSPYVLTTGNGDLGLDTPGNACSWTEGPVPGSESSVISAPGHLPGNPQTDISTPNQAPKGSPSQLPSSGPGPFDTTPIPAPAGTIVDSNEPQEVLSAPVYNIPMICQKLAMTSQQCSHFATLLSRSLSRYQSPHNRPAELNDSPATLPPVSREQHPVPSLAPNGASKGLPTPELTPPLTSDRPLTNTSPGASYRELWDQFQNALEQLSQYRTSNIDLGVRATKLEKLIKKEKDKNQQYRNERDKYMRICGEWITPVPPTGKTKGEVLSLQVASLNKELILAMKSKTLTVEDLAAETRRCRELEVQLEMKDEEVKQLKLALEESKSQHYRNNIQGSASKANRNQPPKEENVTQGGLILPGNVPFTPSTRPKAVTSSPAPMSPPRPTAKPRRRAAKPRRSAGQNSTSDQTAAATTVPAVSPTSAATSVSAVTTASADISLCQTDSRMPNEVVTIDLTTPPTAPFRPMKRKREYSWLPSNKVAKPTPYPSDRRRSREATRVPKASTAKGEELPEVGGDEEEWAAFNEELEREMMDCNEVEESSGDQSRIESNDDGVVEPHPGAEDWTELEVELERELDKCGDDVPMLSSEPSGSSNEGTYQRQMREDSVDSLFNE
jgi:hypothetical protein